MQFFYNILAVIIMLSAVSLLFLVVCRDAKHFTGISPASDARLGHAFLNRLYFVVSTFSTIGYGDVVPVSMRGRMLTVAIIVIVFTVVAKAFANYIDVYNKNVKVYLDSAVNRVIPKSDKQDQKDNFRI